MVSQYKWFWLTFCGWCFIVSVGGWALISSPFHLNSEKISEFSVQVNGAAEVHQILVCHSPLQESLRAISRQWQNDGWKCVTGTLNVAAIALKLPQGARSGLDSLAQLRVFQKGSLFRLLGLLSDFDDEQVYEWVVEVPQRALKNLKPSEVDFPLKPPSNALGIMDIKFEKIEACSWLLQSSKNPDLEFTSTYSAQGFSGRLWSKQDRKSIYILHRGFLRLLAVVEPEKEKNLVSVVKLGKF